MRVIPTEYNIAKMFENGLRADLKRFASDYLTKTYKKLMSVAKTYKNEDLPTLMTRDQKERPRPFGGQDRLIGFMLKRPMLQSLKGLLRDQGH